MPGVGSIQAGKAFVLIEAIDRTGKVLNSVKGKLGHVAAEISSMGRTMAMRAAAALLPAAYATKTFTEFDDVMRKVEARSEGTGGAMDDLRGQARALGREIGMTATEIGRIQNVFAQAGFTREQISQLTKPVATLARAAGDSGDQMENAALAAKATSAILMAYQLPVEKAQEVTDKLAVTLTATNYDLEDITASLQFAAAAGAQYKVSIDEMLASLGAMKDLQIDASIAGTAFRNMMQYISDPQNRNRFNAMLFQMTGKTVEFEDALKNLHSPIQVFPAIMKAMKGLGTEQVGELLGPLLGMRAALPASALGKSMERIAKIMAALSAHSGAAEKMRQIMDSGIGGAFRRMKGIITDLLISLGDAFAPALIGIAKILTPIVDRTIEWVDKNKGLVAIIGMATIGVLGLGLSMIVLGQALLVVTTMIGALTTLTGIMLTIITFVASLGSVPALIIIAGLGFVAMMIDWQAALKSSMSLLSEFGQFWGRLVKDMGRAIEAGAILDAFKILTLQMKVLWLDFVGYLDDIMSRYGIYSILSAARTVAEISTWMPRMIGKGVTRIPGALGGFTEMMTGDPNIHSKLRQYALDQDPVSNLRIKARQAEINSLRKELEELRKKEYPSTPTADSPLGKFDEMLQKLMGDANRLIGTGGIGGALAPTANMGVEGIEAIKQFIESKYSMFNEDGGPQLQALMETASNTAEIKRLLEIRPQVGIA